jgi:hypothetical protein
LINDEDYCENKTTRYYTLKPPIDLEVNFTQEKFEAWLNIIAEENQVEQKTKDRKTFDALLSKYPDWRNNATS